MFALRVTVLTLNIGLFAIFAKDALKIPHPSLAAGTFLLMLAEGMYTTYLFFNLLKGGEEKKIILLIALNYFASTALMIAMRELLAG